MNGWSKIPGTWAAEAVCAQSDPEIFFPDKGQSYGIAKQICRVCPVQVQCLTFALDNGETHGIWGGTTHNDRRAMGYRHRRNIELDYGAPEAPDDEDWHGTPWGIKRHHRNRTEPCIDCRRARRAYARDYNQKRGTP